MHNKEFFGQLLKKDFETIKNYFLLDIFLLCDSFNRFDLTYNNI